MWGSETYGTLAEPGTGYDRIEIGNDAGATNVGSRKATVDEFKMWVGALTATEVMCDFGQVTGEPACCDDIIAAGGGPASDFDGDCMVTMADFAAFAEGWMGCTPGFDENCP